MTELELWLWLQEVENHRIILQIIRIDLSINNPDILQKDRLWNPGNPNILETLMSLFEQSVSAALLCLQILRTSPFHTEVVRPPEFSLWHQQKPNKSAKTGSRSRPPLPRKWAKFAGEKVIIIRAIRVDAKIIQHEFRRFITISEAPSWASFLLAEFLGTFPTMFVFKIWPLICKTKYEDFYQSLPKTGAFIRSARKTNFKIDRRLKDL